MANADFLKKLGLKPHVPVSTADAVPATPSAGDAGRQVSSLPAGSQPPKAEATAQAGASVKPAGLMFKIGGQPIARPQPVADKSIRHPVLVAEQAAGGGLDSGGTVPAGGDNSPPSTGVTAPAVAEVNQNVDPTTDSFQTLLNEFDAMVGAVGNITQLELDQSRNFVARIMKDLVTHPELDGLVIDRDVHNVMKFVQASSGMANKNFVTSQERKSKAADKKAAAAAISLDVFDFGADIAGQMAALKAKKGIKPSKPLQISDLSSLSTDDIETKTRR